MRTTFNQYTGLKYTKEQILEVCKHLRNRKEFEVKFGGMKNCAERLNILNECNIILDKNKKTYKEKKIQDIISYIDNEIVKYPSVSTFLSANKHLHWIFYNNDSIKYKYSNFFKPQKVSTQQLICKLIMEKILQDKCIYNTRKVLSNKKELDIYFEKYSIAIEYNGYYWHKNRKQNDIQKINECKLKEIFLIQINEPYLNAYNTLEKSIFGIKNQIIELLPQINKKTQFEIIPSMIKDIDITIEEILYNTFNQKDLDYLINKCCDYSEVKKKYNKIYQHLTRNKLLHILNPIKKRDYVYMNNDEFIKWSIDTFKSYTEFIKHKCYQLALKRKIKNEIKHKFDILT